MKSKIFLFFSASLMPLLLSACSPVVRIEAPDKPIEINMNVNIKHEIMIKLCNQLGLKRCILFYKIPESNLKSRSTLHRFG